MPAAPTATAEQIKDANTRYHDAAAAEYDAKWGIDFGEVGQAQVRAKLAKALGREPRAVRRRARDRRRHRLLLAQPAPARADRAGDRDRHLARDAGDARGAAPRDARARGRRRSRPRPRRCRSPTRASTSSSATRSCTTSPTSTARSREFHRVLRPGGTVAFCGEPSRYGDRIAAVPKRAGLLAAPVWRRLIGASAAALASRARRATTTTSSSPRSTCTPSRPRELRDARARRGLRRRPGPRRGAARERLRLAAAHARGDRRARRGPVRAGATSPSAATSPCSASTRPLLEPRLPPRALLQPRAQRPAPG